MTTERIRKIAAAHEEAERLHAKVKMLEAGGKSDTIIDPDDIRLLVVDGQYIFTLQQLMTDEQHEANFDRAMSDSTEAHQMALKSRETLINGRLQPYLSTRKAVLRTGDETDG